MTPVKTYMLPVYLDELDKQPAYERHVVLNLLSQFTGFTRIRFIQRGGPRSPLVVHPDEIQHIFPAVGRWEAPAENRFGLSVRPIKTISLGASS